MLCFIFVVAFLYAFLCCLKSFSHIFPFYGAEHSYCKNCNILLPELHSTQNIFVAVV